jgi:hypothetical protein
LLFNKIKYKTNVLKNLLVFDQRIADIVENKLMVILKLIKLKMIERNNLLINANINANNNLINI